MTQNLYLKSQIGVVNGILSGVDPLITRPNERMLLDAVGCLREYEGSVVQATDPKQAEVVTARQPSTEPYSLPERTAIDPTPRPLSTKSEY